MIQDKRLKVPKALGLLLAGPFVAGAVLATADLFEFNVAAAEAARAAERASHPFVRIAQAETGEAAGEASTELPIEPPADPVVEGEAEAPDATAPEAGVEEEKDVVAEEEEEKCCKKGDRTPPFKLIAETPPGELNNPYDWRELAAENEKDPDYLVKQFRSPGCGECHGPNGGGKFCPTLNTGVWSWGNTDDVLFRLITLGSVELEKQGWTRRQRGEIKAPMPEMGQVVKTSDQLWKIVSYIRSINPGANPPDKVLPGKYTPPVEAVPPAEPAPAE
jgi:mono/diheme cytochrome c family protein